MREAAADQLPFEDSRKGLSLFEKYLSVWVILCIVAGIILGKVAPGFAKYLDGLAIYVGEAPVVSIPIAICLFFMMYPIMVKIDFGEVVRAGKKCKACGPHPVCQLGHKALYHVCHFHFFPWHPLLWFHRT